MSRNCHGISAMQDSWYFQISTRQSRCSWERREEHHVRESPLPPEPLLPGFPHLTWGAEQEEGAWACHWGWGVGSFPNSSCSAGWYWAMWASWPMEISALLWRNVFHPPRATGLAGSLWSTFLLLSCALLRVKGGREQPASSLAVATLQKQQSYLDSPLPVWVRGFQVGGWMEK